MLENPNDLNLDASDDMTPERPLNSLKGKTVAFWNAWSICANFNLFRYDFEKSNLLSIAVCETCLTSNTPDCHVELDGFKLVRLDRAYQKRGGGLMCYVNSNYDFENVQDECNHSSTDLEMLSVLVKPHHQRNFLVITIYIPPTAKKSHALNIVETNLTRLINNYGDKLHLIIGGDFNICYKPHSNNGRQ